MAAVDKAGNGRMQPCIGASYECVDSPELDGTRPEGIIHCVLKEKSGI
jgi:hypothetical protein